MVKKLSKRPAMQALAETRPQDDPFELGLLRGRVLWVTGAAGGLGPGICMKIQALTGMSFAIHCFKHLKRAEKLAEELSDAGTPVLVTRGDLSRPNVASDAVARIHASLGNVYGLLHLAGPYVSKPVSDHSREDFDQMILGNLTTFFECAQAVLPDLRLNRDGGRIIAMGMAGAQFTTPMLGHGPHLAAKAGLVALARTLALEEAKQAVTVNVIAPGHLPRKTLSRSAAREASAGPEHPLGVHGSYEDIADAAVFLLSPSASYVTGTVLDVSGGWRRL